MWCHMFWLLNCSMDFSGILFYDAVFFPLGDSPAFEFYMLTFRDTLFHLHRSCGQDHYHPMAPLPRSLTYLSYYRPPLGVIALHSLFLCPDTPRPAGPFSFRLACINTLTISSQLFFLSTPSMKMEQTECSETSAHKVQRPGNHPKEEIQYSEQGKSFQSRTDLGFLCRMSRCPHMTINVSTFNL